MDVEIDHWVGPSPCTSTLHAAGDRSFDNGPLSLPSDSSVPSILDDAFIDEVIDALLDLKNGGGGMLRLPPLPAKAKGKRTPRVSVGPVKKNRMTKNIGVMKKKKTAKKSKPLDPPKIVYESIRLVAPLKLRIKIASSTSASFLQSNLLSGCTNSQTIVQPLGSQSEVGK